MENEKIMVNNYDISMLLGIYMYDQGMIQLNKLAEIIVAPDDKVEEVVRAYRESPVYKEFYSEVSRFMNRQEGLQDTAVLENSAELMNAFYVMNERNVSPATILNEGHADKFLQSTYFLEMFGENLSSLQKTQEEPDIPGWKKLMADTALAKDYADSMEALKAYAAYKASSKGAGTDGQEPGYRQMVADAHQRARLTLANYNKVFDRPYVLPEVARLQDLYAKGDKNRLAAEIRANRMDELVIGQFAEYLYGDDWHKAGRPAGKQEISDSLVEELSRTIWFSNLVGHDLSRVHAEIMLPAQYAVAKGYAEQLARKSADAETAAVKVMTAGAGLLEFQVKMQELNGKLDALLARVEQRDELAAVTEKFVKGEGQGVDKGFFESESFKQVYGEELALLPAIGGPEDVMVIEQYRSQLEARAKEMATRLSIEPSEEKVKEYLAYEKLSVKIESVSERMEKLYAGTPAVLEELTPDFAAKMTQDKTVMLLYKESSGKFYVCEAGSALRTAEEYSVVDRYTTVGRALDFVRSVEQKLQQAHVAVLATDSMRNEYKVYRSLTPDKLVAFQGLDILPSEQASKSEHPDVSAMRRYAFEYKQRVEFDLANPGVIDVVQTDANRAEYQEKLEKDSGIDRTKSGGRSIG